MSKQMIKKFRKNDWSYDDEEYVSPKNKVNKRKEKRVERALRTKDLTALLEDEDETGFESNYSTFEEENL